MVYYCKICNYSTQSNSNYHKHLKTKKHNNNTKSVSNTGNESILSSSNATFVQQSATLCNTTTHSVEKENFICKFCDREFTKHQSYYRHMKYYCKHKKNIIDNNETNNYRFLMEKIIDIKDENRREMKDLFMEVLSSQKENMRETMTMILDDKNKNNELLINAANCNKGNINNFTQNNTMNNTNYVLNYINYSEADSMNHIKDKFKLTRDEFIKASMTTGYKGALMEKADNIIIKPYLKSQEKRPMQTVDIARKKALYKDNQSENWTFTPKITLDQCFNEFHLSALNHQDQTINENPNLVIDSVEDNLYKQTYFIPTEIKDKESIYRDVKNHIYKNTKVKRIEKDSFSNNPEIDLLCYKDNSIYDPEDKYKDMYNCGKQVLYNEYNYVFDFETKKCIGQREYDKHIQKYFVKKFE
tara:strand:- start:1375 stop:2619 length:1245 start_codon:yes stop_codon:yes gene_type:complete